MRLSVAERGSQLKTLKQAAFVDVMYLKTRSILKAAPGSSYLHRFVSRHNFCFSYSKKDKKRFFSKEAIPRKCFLIFRAASSED
jgi:hypothetical protein